MPYKDREENGGDEDGDELRPARGVGGERGCVPVHLIHGVKYVVWEGAVERGG